jgi:hypothetical protein
MPKISETIAALTAIHAVHGDLDVVVYLDSPEAEWHEFDVEMNADGPKPVATVVLSGENRQRSW